MNLETERLIFTPNNLEIITARLERDNFDLEVPGVGLVHFPPEFPGDPLVMYPMMRDWIIAGHALSLGGIVIERSSLTAIGEMGCKGAPDLSGAVDIGYGLNVSVWNRGYATEMLRAFVAKLLEQPGIRVVAAETATTNPASARVLEKSGFVQVGRSWNEDDGDLLVWHRTN